MMTEALDISPGDRVLEVGTGSGYQAAVLAEMGVKVYSVEIIPALAEWSEGNLRGAGYEEVKQRTTTDISVGRMRHRSTGSS